jgi:hypothetical protein
MIFWDNSVFLVVSPIVLFSGQNSITSITSVFELPTTSFRDFPHMTMEDAIGSETSSWEKSCRSNVRDDCGDPG